MHAVVTGGAGFIGSALVDRLVGAGHSVTVIDDLSTGSPRNLSESLGAAPSRLVVHEHDIADPKTVDVVAASHPDVVFHLAAQADVRVSVARPAHDAHVNIVGSLHVLEGARLARARKVVFASSGGTIYGDVPAERLPIKESEAQRPLSPYGVAKKAVGDYLYAYRELHGVEYTALALANVFGPRQDPLGEAGVVAIFAGLLLSARRCTIFGDGEQTRDFVYVADVADAFMRAAEAGDGRLINVGTGVETSVNHLYRTMAVAARRDQDPIHAEARPGELRRSVLDPTAAGVTLGWKPSTSLEKGVEEVLRHFAHA